MDETGIKTLEREISNYKKLITKLQKLAEDKTAPTNEIETVIKFLKLKIKKDQRKYNKLRNDILEEADALVAAYEDMGVIF